MKKCFVFPFACVVPSLLGPILLIRKKEGKRFIWQSGLPPFGCSKKRGISGALCDSVPVFWRKRLSCAALLFPHYSRNA